MGGLEGASEGGIKRVFEGARERERDQGALTDQGREGGREEGREGKGRERERRRGSEEAREEERATEGRREGGRELGREGWREEGREGGGERGKEGGKEGRRTDGRKGGREGRGRVGSVLFQYRKSSDNCKTILQLDAVELFSCQRLFPLNRRGSCGLLPSIFQTKVVAHVRNQ